MRPNLTLTLVRPLARCCSCSGFECYAWAPWVGGGLVGILQFPIVIMMHDTIGSSTAYVAISSFLLHAIPETLHHHHGLSYLKKYAWDACLLLHPVSSGSSATSRPAF